jgi:hypothetical protein
MKPTERELCASGQYDAIEEHRVQSPPFYRRGGLPAVRCANMKMNILLLLSALVQLGSNPYLPEQRVQLFRVTQKGKYGFIDSSGALVIKAKYDNAGNFHDGFAPVNLGGEPYGEHFRGGKWGYIDLRGKLAIQLGFDYARDFKEGLAPVALRADSGNSDLPVLKWGFVQSDGRLVVLPQFSEVTSFHNGRAAVRQNGKWGVVDTKGKLIISPQYRQDFQFDQGRTWVQCDGYGWGIIDTNGVEVRPCNLSLWSIDGFSEGLSVVGTKDKHWLFLNLTGNVILDLTYEWVTGFHNGLARVTDKGKSVFIDRAGNVLLKTDYDWTGEAGDGLVLIQTGGKYGFADERSWHVVIDQKFADAEPFHSGLAAVKLQNEGKIGFIDLHGTMVIEPTFTYASDFDGPLCWVSRNCQNQQYPFEESGYVDKSGKLVWIND